MTLWIVWTYLTKNENNQNHEIIIYDNKKDALKACYTLNNEKYSPKAITLVTDFLDSKNLDYSYHCSKMKTKCKGLYCLLIQDLTDYPGQKWLYIFEYKQSAINECLKFYKGDKKKVLLQI